MKPQKLPNPGRRRSELELHLVWGVHASSVNLRFQLGNAEFDCGATGFSSNVPSLFLLKGLVSSGRPFGIIDAQVLELLPKIPVLGQVQLAHAFVDGLLYAHYPGLGTTHWITLSDPELLFSYAAQACPYSFAVPVPLGAWR